MIVTAVTPVEDTEYYADITNLLASEEYWFRNYVTNDVDEAWAQNKMSFTTDVTTVSLSIDTTSLEEGGSATLTATLGGTSAVNVTAQLGFSGDAVRNTVLHLRRHSIVVSAGSLTGTTGITITDDEDVEGAESFTVTITNALNATLQAPSSVIPTIAASDLTALFYDDFEDTPTPPTEANLDAGIADGVGDWSNVTDVNSSIEESGGTNALVLHRRVAPTALSSLPCYL